MTDVRPDDTTGGSNDGHQPDPGGGGRKRVHPIIKIFLFCCVVLLLLDLVIHREVHHPWENLFGFYAIYGFVACVLLVLAATQMRRVLMRSEDYYDAD